MSSVNKSSKQQGETRLPIAQVVVDVPTFQTNTSYSYLIPANLVSIIKVGMRVVVPFGRRQVVGFVVALNDNIEFDGQLKPIIELIDLKPVINEELLQLAQWMADDTYSFLISCLQTMIPGGMRTKVKKYLVPNTPSAEEMVNQIFGKKGKVEYQNKQLDSATTATIAKLIQTKQATFEYILSKKTSEINQLAITSLIDEAQAAKIKQHLKKNATSQQRLLTILGQLTEPILQSELTKQKINASTIKVGEQNGWLQKTTIVKNRDPFRQEVQSTQPLKLQPDQDHAVTTINEAITQQQPTTFLLEGVTGSGKTEVYLQVIANALKLGKTALLLVPEITLTPQITNRIRSRFGNKVAMLHSAMSVGERFDEWQRIESGQAKVVVGVRSAVFAPLDNLGVIIMDEEHDSSYKQADNPRYHTRDVAKWRAQYHHCPVVLGSATPSLESRARAYKGIYQRLLLPKRINDHALPHVDIIDMKNEIANGAPSDLSQPLIAAIDDRLQKHEQVILMLNRRGYASFVLCRSCGHVPQCPNCDISLTYHKDTNSLRCHYCGFSQPMPNKCPECGSEKLRQHGMGSQRLEEDVNQLFPTAKVVRMDVDTTRKKGSHERIIQQFGQQEADILVGTQMIAKGLDFPNVTLVGVLNADSALEFPDFRSSERTFELLTQVAGRAGRADKQGNVIIQTFNPDHYAIQLAKTQDYEKFYETEMKVRQQGKYSPYYYTVKITISSKEETQALKVAYEIQQTLVNQLSEQTIILGPTPKMIKRVNNQYYYQLIVKYRREPELHLTLTDLLYDAQNKAKKGVQIVIDNEPLDFM